MAKEKKLAGILVGLELDELAVKEKLIPSPEVGRSNPRYIDALAASLRVMDQDIRYFSKEFYFASYPDIAAAQAEPLVHYLMHGRHEGRVTNVNLLDRIYLNDDVTIIEKPYIIVTVHEASKTGAPIVGLDLAKELSLTYNVIFVSMRDGPIIEVARRLFPVVIVAGHNDGENRFFLDYIEKNYTANDAIFSSTVCYTLIQLMSCSDYRITCLVHEFLEYMIPARSVIYLCDLLVFSSRELLKSWQYMLDDYMRDPETNLVLQQPASSTNVRVMAKESARAAVTAATGLDLEGATLVLGAGQIQIRKGTDIFLQVANQLKRETGKFVAIWIGEQVSEFDPAYGIWFHAQMERSRDDAGALSVYFEPAGPLYPVLMDAADVFLVTSRLDPLPNVALDAAIRDLPVISFSGATGLADIAEQGRMNLVEVGIAAIDEVVSAIKSLSRHGEPDVDDTHAWPANASAK